MLYMCTHAPPHTQVSRRYEQCDAEGVLLQHGVQDPTAHYNPLETNLDPQQPLSEGPLDTPVEDPPAAQEYHHHPEPETAPPAEPETVPPAAAQAGTSFLETKPHAQQGEASDAAPPPASSPHATSAPQPTGGLAPSRLLALDDAASDVSTCHTDLLQHVGSLSALSVADFLAREGDEEDKLVDEPVCVCGCGGVFMLGVFL